MADFSKRDLPSKADDISAWYNALVTQAGLVEHSDVKGCLVLRPNGYALWEKVFATIDPWFKDYDVKNVYFPLLIPMSLIEAEKKHLEGFSPELAVVTHAGGEKLAEPYAVRPTSETVITKSFASWIASHRDLPLKLNQWCNVMRWEKRTYPFIRTTEFLWQEGHTVHADKENAMEMVMKAVGWYRKFYEEYAALAPYVGIKSTSERFAGADETFTLELVMPNGKALQGATSHYLGQNFTKVFGVEYTDESGAKVNPHQTSWGISTRYIGGLILSHGDDAGLIIPPKLAPVQAVIVPIFGKDEASHVHVEKYATALDDSLKKVGVKSLLDLDKQHTLGFRINRYELEGVPLRIELGAKEIAENKITLVDRLTFEKKQILVESAKTGIPEALERIQAELFGRARMMRDELTAEAASYEEFKQAIENKKFVRVVWCEEPACEEKVKAETHAGSRLLELDRMNEKIGGKCFKCGNGAQRKWLFAQSY